MLFAPLGSDSVGRGGPACGYPADRAGSLGQFAGIACRSDGGVSALYNMALAECSLKSDLVSRGAPPDIPVHAFHVDKLRLVWGDALDRASDSVADRLKGAVTSGDRRRFRNRGGVPGYRSWGRYPLTPDVCLCDDGGLPADDGVFAYVQRDDFEDRGSTWVVEFNPAHCSVPEFMGVCGICSVLGLPLDRAFVDRTDGAVDYSCPRALLLLDDRHRLADHFGVGPCGPETERTGFRKGSRLKYQLYDKRAERAAKGVPVPADMTRFEVQVLKPGSLRGGLPLFDGRGEYTGNGDTLLRLVDLPRLPWPGGDVTARVFRVDPSTVKSALLSAAAVGARSLGLRFARHFLRLWNNKLDPVLLGAVIPEVSPSPAWVWRRRWPAAAAAVLAGLGVGVAGA